MNSLVVCPYCDKEMKQITKNHLYYKHSKTMEDLKREFPDCKLTSDLVKDKMKQTFIKNYGVDNPSKSPEVLNKIKETFINKYGVTCSLHNPMIQEKVKETNKRKYGTDHYFSSDDAKEKINEACLKKYGGNPRKTEQVKEKSKKTCLERYGVDNPFKSSEVKDKIKKTNIERYGCDNPSKNEDIQKKKHDTIELRYGKDYHLYTTDISKKKYNTENISKLDFVKEKKKKTLMEKHIPKMNKILETFNIELYSEKYIDAHAKHEWRCLICNNIFESCWNYIQQGYLCPTCHPKTSGVSKSENEIKEFVKSLGFEIIENDRELIKPKELDIVIPEEKIAIEYCGLYWHSDEQKDKQYHIDKLNKCEEKGYKLILIFEDEWILNKDLVMNRLIHILNKSDSTRIHARKCEIKEIPTNLKNEFLDLFHIQSSDASNIKLGAFYKNELIAVMTFSHGNISKGSKPKSEVWELNRFCTNYIYHIPGIASKMLEFFKKNYEWELIFSYADRRWSSGNLYEKIGFKFDKITEPNYWYVKGIERIHRFKLRKRRDEPKEISESNLRLSEGYRRIYDCGSIKYILYNKNK